MNTIVKDFFNLVFPHLCLSCERSLLKGEQDICMACIHKLPKTDFHLIQENELGRKLWGRVPVVHSLAYLYFEKGGMTQSILHHIKYKEAKRVAHTLGLWYADDLRKYSFHEKFDTIVAVPLHPKKLRKRGYNQSACFAEGLADGMSIPFASSALEREKEGSSQTNKNREERWENVSTVYRIVQPSAVSGKKVLLVDDVATTGATLEVCTSALLENGAKEVSVAVLAVAI